MLRIGQRIAARNVEVIEIDVMQEHIDAAKIVRRNVDLLPVKAVSHILLAENFGKLQQERATAADGIHWHVVFDTSERCTQIPLER